MKLNITPTKPLPVLYISGPMTGFPDDNFAEFDRVADFLRALGFRVINPADFGHTDEGVDTMSIVARDLSVLHRAEVLILLDDWDRSKGAGIEFDFAIAYGRRAVMLGDVEPFLYEFFDAEELTDAALIYLGRTALSDRIISFVMDSDYIIRATATEPDETEEEGDEGVAALEKPRAPASRPVEINPGE